MVKNSPVGEAELISMLSAKTEEFLPHFTPGFLPRDEAVFQFSFDVGLPFHLAVTNTHFEFMGGEHEQPTIRLEISDHASCWGLLDGREDAMQAFMEGRYRADGNIVLSQLLLYLFKSNDPTIAYEIQY